MTKEIVLAIKTLINTLGWDAVRKHPIYGPIWKAQLQKDRKFIDSFDK